MDPANAYYTFGSERFGPFLFGFVRWLHDELTRKHYDKVFFFSRDGYMMKKAFDLISSGGIKSEYVYVSRKSLRQTLFWNCNDHESALQFLSWKRYYSLTELLDYYGISADDWEAARNGSVDVSTVIPFDQLRSSSLARRVYEENRSRIRTESMQQAQYLSAYLKQIGMTGRCAVVDIGWHGNMQYYLDVFAKDNLPDLQPEGFYIGICPVQQLTSPVNGYLYTADHLTHQKHLLCFLGCLERLLQSLEGSASGYQQDENGRILPRLQDYEYAGQQQITDAISQWQRGALDTVRKLSGSEQNLSDQELTAPLLRFGMYPRMEDVKLFSSFYNTDGIRIWYTAQKPLYRYRPKELLRALAESPWKTGFLRSVFRIPFPYYWIYCLLKK